MTAPTTPVPAICGTRHESWPETICTEPPGHRMPHGGPLIINGRECGGAAWGPDDGYADAQPAPVPDPALVLRAAEAIREAACNGDCDRTEEECVRQRIQPVVWHFGVLAEVDGTPEQFAAAVLAALAPELAELLDYRTRITWETTCREHARMLDACRHADERAEQAEAALERVRRVAGWAVNGWSDLTPEKVLRALTPTADTPKEPTT